MSFFLLPLYYNHSGNIATTIKLKNNGNYNSDYQKNQ